MECSVAGETPAAVQSNELKKTESSENFQKFIYDLFEKNGILNDLRAYLRGHIVNVLKNAQNGDPPPCQKHFTQRLQLIFQALNILIAEYLLCLEFSYSLSVFVSEIPLANMVFEFAKTLLQCVPEGDCAKLRFKDCDIWSILNYLGVKCDSIHASSIVEMYKTDEHTPLLLCILKCIPLYRPPSGIMNQDAAASSDDSMSTTAKSCDTVDEKGSGTARRKRSFHDKCRHTVVCKACRARIAGLRDKYKRKKKLLAENIGESNLNPIKVESFMRNVGLMERNLINEMFEQLKSVYEAELTMVKEEEKKNIKRSLTTHTQHFEKQREEMEESFRAREEELQRSVAQKKKFLWGLARALRRQHGQMAAAMRTVRREAERLAEKEESLKIQVAEAEVLLKKRGEEMRLEISRELNILENHMDSIKREREHITKERSELDEIKATDSKRMIESDIQIKKTKDDMKEHYDLLKNEFQILKKYIDSSKMKPLCIIERSTMTEAGDFEVKMNFVLNNRQEPSSYLRCPPEVKAFGLKTPNKVVNDLKKKIVNFDQGGACEAPSPGSSDATAALLQLRRDNEQLRTLASQQNERIACLSRASPLRPRTAPALPPRRCCCFLHGSEPGAGTSFSANSFSCVCGGGGAVCGCGRGAGEEVGVSVGARPRELSPGAALPFVGVLSATRDARSRHPPSWWRGAGAGSGGGRVVKARSPPPRRRDTGETSQSARRPAQAQAAERSDGVEYQAIFFESTQQRPRSALAALPGESRDRSPAHSESRPPKETLWYKENVRKHSPSKREQSPNSALREAKLRLRKLEIEAEAVEKSYLDFRKRQSERKKYSETTRDEPTDYEVTRDLGVKRSHSLHEMQKYSPDVALDSSTIDRNLKQDFHKYMKEYAKYDIGVSHFHVRNTSERLAKPIPSAYSEVANKQKEYKPKENYLEAPLTEFRKLYHSSEKTKPREPRTRSPKHKRIDVHESSTSSDIEVLKRGREAMRSTQDEKKAELEILKQNITKIYNIKRDDDVDPQIEPSADVNKDEIEPSADVNKAEVEMDTSEVAIEESEKNLLKIEVENISQSNNIKLSRSDDTVQKPDELYLVVESSIDDRGEALSDSQFLETKRSPHKTIIVSPVSSCETKKSSDKSRRSVSPEQAARLTRNDVLDAIFQADTNQQLSSVEIDLDVSKDVLEESAFDRDNDDYGDDFSADVDNYNSRSDYDNDHSPISLPKTSEDETFWEE